LNRRPGIVLGHFSNLAVLHQAGVRSRQKNFPGNSKKSLFHFNSFLIIIPDHEGCHRMRITKKTPALEIYQQAYQLYQIRILTILTLIPLYILTNRWGRFDVNIWPLILVILIEVFINRPYRFLYTDSESSYRAMVGSVIIDFVAETTLLHLLGDIDFFIYGVCYFITMVYCALRFPAFMTLLFATLASFLYVGLLALGQAGLIPLTISFGPEVTLTEQVGFVVRQIAFFYLIGILVRFVAKAMTQKEEHLEELIWELKSTNEKIKYAHHLQTDYFAKMSHEIRAPLNSIMGFSQLLLENTTGPLTEKQRDFIARIERSGSHLRDMINDVLDISKIESKKMTLSLREVNLVKVIDSVFDFFYEEASLKKILFAVTDKPKEPLLVTCDELKIRQVLYNLLSNAIKFTPSGGHIAMSLKKGPEGAIICIDDSGPGISPEFQKVIFTPYEQTGRTTNTESKGTGLGLAISKQFVTMHGGKIYVKSEPGQGSQFYVEIPFRAKPLSGNKPAASGNFPEQFGSINP